MKLTFLKDYLYLLEAEDYDYPKALDFFKRYKIPTGSCSAIRKGNYIGRNFDWYYDELVDVIVKTRPKRNRYATVGVAHSVKPLTNSFVKENIHLSEPFENLPFLVTDCINTEGFYCSINVVSLTDKENVTPIGNGQDEVCEIMLPRYLCDRAKNIDEAIDILRNIKVYAPSITGEACHLLLADDNTTKVVEFINGEIKIIDNSILTNFYLDGWNGTIASATLGNTEEEIMETGLTNHAMGLERYLILSDLYSDIESESDMVNAMKAVAYTKTYNSAMDPYWYSEFYGITETFGDLTIYSSKEEMAPIVQYAIEHYAPGFRNGESWYSTHTSIYDIANRTLKVYSGEDYSEFFIAEINNKPLYGIIGIDNLFSDFRMV